MYSISIYLIITLRFVQLEPTYTNYTDITKASLSPAAPRQQDHIVRGGVLSASDDPLDSLPIVPGRTQETPLHLTPDPEGQGHATHQAPAPRPSGSGCFPDARAGM